MITLISILLISALIGLVIGGLLHPSDRSHPTAPSDSPPSPSLATSPFGALLPVACERCQIIFSFTPWGGDGLCESCFESWRAEDARLNPPGVFLPHPQHQLRKNRK